MFALAAAGIIISASTVSALSSSCTSFVTSLALSGEADCLNIAGLVPLATLSSSASIVPSLDTWLTGLCTQTTPCSNSTLTAIGTNITTSCASDLEGYGLTSTMVDSIPSLLTQYYGVANEALCTRNTNTTDAFCTSQELNILQSSLGTNLTPSNAISSLVGVLSNTTLESQLACTTCAQGMYAIVRPQLSSSMQSQLDSTLNGVCGSGFASSTEPSGIIVATGSLATDIAKSTSTSAARKSLSSPFTGIRTAIGLSVGAAMAGGVAIVTGM